MRLRAAIAALGLLAGAQSAAQKPEVDPDSAEMLAKAREALARAERRSLEGESRPLDGERRELKGLGLAVAGKAEDISGLLRDLNAETRGREVRISLAADVLFDFDKAELKPEARPALEKVAAVLKSYPNAQTRIEGHTDAKGDDAYNQKLSERRADSVRKWLAANGAGTKIGTQGFGRKKPVAPNTTKDGKDSPEGRQKNRRVEIVVIRQGGER